MKNIRRIHWMFAVVITVFALSLNAFAQPGGGPGRGQGQGPGQGMGMGGGMGMGMGMPGGLLGGIMSPEFATELELTPQQATELRGVVTRAMEEFRTQGQNMQRPEPGAPPGPEMRQQFEEMRQQMETRMNEVQSRVDQVLRPEQRSRLRDVTFQLSGGLNSPMLGTPMGERALESLSLTDAQKAQFRGILEDRNAAMARERENIGEVDWRDPAVRERLRTENEARNARFADQVRGILTAEQREKAEKLTAEAPALRERLGIPAPGAQQRGQQGQGGRQQTAPGGGFVPGAGAWRPGQDAPSAPASGTQPRRTFPRGEN